MLKTCQKRTLNFLAALAISTLMSTQLYGQQLKVVYVNFDNPIDTSKWELSPNKIRQDTMAKWVLYFEDGKGLLEQTEDSEYERKWTLLNKETREFDNFTSYNMSRYNVYYNDYVNNTMRHVTHFFDIKYVIDDELLYYEWTLLEGEKSILGHSCKLAEAFYPLDKNLLWRVWYTTDTSIQGGPSDLNGLPGLILEVERNGVLQYRAISIEEVSGPSKIQIEKPAPNEKAITMGEYQKIRTGVPFKNYNKRPPNQKN